MAATTTSSFTAAQQTLFKKEALDWLRKNLYFHQSGLMEKIGKNQGQVISVYRIDNLSAATSTLTEGTAPSEVQMTSTLFTATLAQYGNWVKVTDMLQVTGRADSMQQFGRQLGYNGALSVDTLTYTEYLSGATAFYANGTDSGTFAANSYFTSKDIRRLAKLFRATEVSTYDDGMYALYLHPDCEFDVNTDNQFGGVVDLQRRAEQDIKWKNVVGTYGGFRVYTTSLITTATVNEQTAYQNLAVGYGALMNVHVDGLPFNLFVNDPSNVTISNPLGQLGSIGWKATYAAKFIGTDGPRAYKVYATASEPTP
jgi:N4-gp56 family major capsid protein